LTLIVAKREDENMLRRTKKTHKPSPKIKKASAKKNTPPPAIKKRRRKKSRDGAYRPGNKRKYNKKSSGKTVRPSNLRMKSDLEIDGQPVKTTVMFDIAIFDQSSLNVSEVKNLIATNVTTARTYRPVHQIIEFSKNGSPITVITPGKSQLERKNRMRSCSFFNNVRREIKFDTIETQTIIDPSSGFFASEAYKNIKEIHDTVKLQDVTVTCALLNKTRRNHHMNGKQRVTSQHKKMVRDDVSEKLGSARTYTVATELFSETLKWEWLHLVAYMILGPESQDADNLVSGTNHANSMMMLAENEMEYLAKHYPKGFQLSIRANLIPNTHIATTIEYSIKTKDFELPMEFSAQNPNQPHADYQIYVHSVFKAFVETAKNTTLTTTSTNTTAVSQSDNSMLFFNRKQVDKEDIDPQHQKQAMPESILKL
jgi:hypothetical protein